MHTVCEQGTSALNLTKHMFRTKDSSAKEKTMHTIIQLASFEIGYSNTDSSTYISVCNQNIIRDALYFNIVGDANNLRTHFIPTCCQGNSCTSQTISWPCVMDSPPSPTHACTQFFAPFAYGFHNRVHAYVGVGVGSFAHNHETVCDVQLFPWRHVGMKCVRRLFASPTT